MCLYLFIGMAEQINGLKHQGMPYQKYNGNDQGVNKAHSPFSQPRLSHNTYTNSNKDLKRN